MKNKELENICNTYKDKSNKELSNILVSLDNDFNGIKLVMLDLAIGIGEIEETYNNVYNELHKRLKFND